MRGKHWSVYIKYEGETLAIYIKYARENWSVYIKYEGETLVGLYIKYEGETLVGLYQI